MSAPVKFEEDKFFPQTIQKYSFGKGNNFDHKESFNSYQMLKLNDR
jgi:hypothetical protein